MARKKLEPQHDDHINVTPLIDIVMCLIIFFMVCGKMAQEEFSAITIPKASKAREIEDQKNRLVVNIEPDVPANMAKDDPNAKKAQMAKFKIGAREVPEDKLVEELRKAKADNPELRLLIRADKDLPYPFISPLIVACARADIGSMHFATESEE